MKTKSYIFLALCAFLSTSLHAQGQDFLIKTLKGENSVGASADSYEAPVEGQRYPLGYWLKTHKRSSSVVIEFDPRYVVLLRPKSEVVVGGQGDLDERFQRVLDLKGGSVALDLEKLPKQGKIRVETPTAIGGAVGTEFSVDADTGEFHITEGSIEAQAKDDDIFKAKSVSGQFFLKRGLENSFVQANQIEGDFAVNGQAVAASSFSVAKAAGGVSDAAIRMGGKPMLMKNGVLEPVDDSLAGTHAQYLNAAEKEGGLYAQREVLKATGGDTASVEVALAAAAKEASELRLKLFQRKTAREAAKDAARKAMRR